MMKKFEKGFVLLLAMTMLLSNMCLTSFASISGLKIDSNAYEVQTTKLGSPSNVTSVALYDTNIAVNLKNVKATEGKTYIVSVDADSDFTSMDAEEYYTFSYNNKSVQDWLINNLKVTGKSGKLNLTIKESGTNFTEYKTLTIGEAVIEDESTLSADKSSTTTNDSTVPNLIIKASSIGKQSVKAGDTFTLSLDVYATTSGYLTAKDVVVSVTSDEGTTVASGSSSYYVGDMTAGSTKTVTFPMKALNSFTGGVSKITVSVGSNSNSSTTTISVPVVQPDRFEVTKVEVPEILMVGEEGMLSAVYINKGKNPAYNVSAKLECEGLTETLQEEYIGNVAAGTQESVDFDISALEAGTVEGKITITYENVDGDEESIEKEFSITVEEASYDEEMWGDSETYEDIPIEQHTSAWVYIVIGVAVIAVVVAVIAISKKKKAKKLLLEESLTDDEDI